MLCKRSPTFERHSLPWNRLRTLAAPAFTPPSAALSLPLPLFSLYSSGQRSPVAFLPIELRTHKHMRSFPSPELTDTCSCPPSSSLDLHKGSRSAFLMDGQHSQLQPRDACRNAITRGLLQLAKPQTGSCVCPPHPRLPPIVCLRCCPLVVLMRVFFFFVCPRLFVLSVTPTRRAHTEEEEPASTFFGSVCAQRGFSLLFSQKSDTHFTSHQPPGLGVGDEGVLLRSQHKPDPSG